jgi:gliding-associated putative ABC transporter substrate-binding component GldG
MQAIWTIAKRELASFFDSLIAYIMLILFLGFSGFFTWLYGSNIFFTGQASLQTFFSVAFWTLFFFIPALTMRLLAEEKKTGTIELLLTKAVTDRQVVIGKFLSTLLLVAIALLFTLPYVITVSKLGNLDLGQVVCGYFGLLLMSAAYISIGLFASSITSNQIVAFLSALFISLFFHLIFGILSNNFNGWVGHVLDILSLSSHFQSISRGVVDSRDLIYFLSIVFLGLFLAEYSLSKRNIEPGTTVKGGPSLRSKIYASIALICGIVICVNMVSDEYHVRLDLTENHQYTLSHATRNILKHLDEPVTVTAYFSKDLPPRIMKAREDFQDMLIEYANRSKGMLMYKFINPNGKETTEEEATKAGIRPVVINVREKDQMKQQKAFMGAVVSLGKDKQVLPFLGPGSPLEYDLSSAIKKLSVTHKPSIGFLQGNGEPPLSEMPQAEKQLQVLYQTTPVTLTDSTFIPSGMKTLAIIAPTDSLSVTNLHQLDTFLARGGHLLVALDHVNGNLRMGMGHVQHTGLSSWLHKKGIDIGNNFVIDAQCASIQVQQQAGYFNFQTGVPFPFFPLISNFATHPVTSGLESVMLRFASTVSFRGDSSIQFTPLAYTSDMSDTLEAPQYFNLQRQWNQNDFTKKDLCVAAAFQGNLARVPHAAHSRMVVIGDGDFAVNGPPRQAQQLDPDDVSFLSNAIDWLSDETGLIALRTKGVTSRPIRQISDGTKNFLKYLNFLLPILLAIGYGLFRARNNRKKRLKRMQENFEKTKAPLQESPAVL